MLNHMLSNRNNRDRMPEVAPKTFKGVHCMKPTTRVLRLLAALLAVGALFATSMAPASASASKKTVSASHAASSATTAAAAQTVAAHKPNPGKCTTFWCLHPYCHTYYCWHKYCHTWYCIHKHHIPPYGKHFKKRRPHIKVPSTAVKQGGTLALSVDDVDSVRLSLVSSNRSTVPLGLYTTEVATGLLSHAVKFPAGISGSYSLVATDAVSHESSSIPLFIAPTVAKVKAAPAMKVASSRTPSSNAGFSVAAVIGLGVLALGMLGSGSTMLLLGRRRRAWRARA